MAGKNVTDSMTETDPTTQPSDRIALRLQLAETVERQWPHFKYMGFGFLYAWIFLSYNSHVLSEEPTAIYLTSTLGLAITLLICAIFKDFVTEIVENFTATFAFGLVASVATVFEAVFAPAGFGSPAFVVSGLLTGVGTAVVVLRHGRLYSRIPIRKSFSNVCGAFIVGGVLYFVISALPSSLALVLTAALPAFSVILTITYRYCLDGELKGDDPDRVQAEKIPTYFLPRLMLAIVVFAFIAGYVKGNDAAQMTSSLDFSLDTMVIFLTMVSALALYIISGALPRRVDFSRLYSPIIVITAFGIAVSPLLDFPWLSAGLLVGVSYNIFIIIMFCILAHVSYRTSWNSVRIFGVGRGASALGTTAGWGISWLIASWGILEGMDYVVAIVFCFILVFVAMVLLKEGSIEEVLAQTDDDDDDQPAEEADISPDRWTASCEALADACKLSNREREVLMLLGRGHTIDNIAEELTVSFNTAKTHVKHVYTKADVHSRSELIKLIEAGARK